MIAILALNSRTEDQAHEIGDLMRGLLGEDTIVRLSDEGHTTVAEVAGVVVKVSRRNQPIPEDLLDGTVASRRAGCWVPGEEHPVSGSPALDRMTATE